MTDLLQAVLGILKLDLVQGFLGLLNSVCGAGLGAAFYILLKSQKYLVNRSFDPKYNHVYFARFATGVVSGFLLSIFLKSFHLESSLAKLTPGMIAILGGYSAEAVEQILQRLVEALTALVRGDGATQAKAELTANKAELAAEQAKRHLAVRQKLAELESLPATEAAKRAQAVTDIQALLK